MIEQQTTLTEKEILISDVVQQSLDKGWSIALWRLPHSPTLQLLLTESDSTIQDVNLESLPPGFLFSPFKPDQPKIFLKAECLAEFELDGKLKSTNPGSTKSLNDFLTFSQANNERKNQQITQVNSESAKTTDFIALVSACLNMIRSGQVEKLVPARHKIASVPEGTEPGQLLNELIRAYPHALVSLVYSPKSGLWIGATPEPLISIDRHGMFRTVALAGTKAYDASIPEQAVTWTQKEIEEQALVERYIISCFKTIRLREYEEYGPKTYRAGNLLHLRSVFEVNLNEVSFPDLGTVMLRLLHPTSAVCGMPRQTALDFLEKNEGFDREFFAGYLGPVNLNNESHLFVNLRCLKWTGNRVRLYAGAGVTADSDPKAEYAECELKMDTLLRFLKSGDKPQA